MDDTCAITRPTTNTALDHTTGKIVTLPAGDVYTGKAKIKPMNEAQPKDDERGDRTRSSRFYTVGIPADSPMVVEGDTVAWTSSRRDPQLVGLDLVVREVVVGSMLVQRKLIVERIA